MTLSTTTAALTLVLSATVSNPLTLAAQTGKWGVDLTARDTSVRPGDDFFRYANGAWFDKAVIPADQSDTGIYRDATRRADSLVKSLIEDAARNPVTPDAKKIGALYQSFMDEPRLNRLGAQPIQGDLASLRRVVSKDDLGLWLARRQGSFALSFFVLEVIIDAKAPTRRVVRIRQDGLGIGDREFYLNAKFADLRKAYVAYISRALRMGGWPSPDQRATEILALETRIAAASWSIAERRDRGRLYNPERVADLTTDFPGFPWQSLLKGAGIVTDTVIVAEKTGFPKIAAIYATTPLEVLKAWEAFQFIDRASPYLSKQFSDSRFEFRDKAREGIDTESPRWSRGVELSNDCLGDAVGKEYVAKYFPPATKAALQVIAANLKTVMRSRIERLEWMSPKTKETALSKLAKVRILVGYPNSWRDYSGLAIKSDDLYGNAKRCRDFEFGYRLANLRTPVDPEEWLMPAQSVDAYAHFARMVVAFAAGYLQPPFFDPHADMAVNYGAAAAIMGHEITHHFDDQGRKVDATGALRDWWTPEDDQHYEAYASKLAAQVDKYEVAPGVHLNGKQTAGENLADIAGLTLAMDAYHLALGGKSAPVIDGLTGDQRLFLAFAQLWRTKDREDRLKMLATEDVHSPVVFRTNGSVRNVDAWYSAFGIKPGDKLYLAPEERVSIW